MKHLILLTIVFLSSLNIHSQTDSSSINYSDILIKVIKSSLGGNSTENAILKDCSTNISEKDYKMMTKAPYFNDSAFISNNLKTDEFKWSDYITSNEIKTISCDTLNSVFKNKDGWADFKNEYASCIISCSQPIFSNDKSMFVVKIGIQCGWTTGYGYTKLYRRIKTGEWISSTVISQWIS